MTLIGDLSPEEIAKLSPQDIDRYFMLECAEAGLPISDPPVPEHPRLAVAPDAQVYTVGEFAVCTEEEAQRIRDALKLCVLVDLSYCSLGAREYTKYIGHRVDAPLVQVQLVYSSELYRRSISILEQHNVATTQFETDKKNYERIIKARTMIATRVSMAVDNANQRNKKRDVICAQMREYEQLAGGDLEIAFRFLKKLHPTVAEDFPEVFSGGWVRYAMLDRSKNGLPEINPSEMQRATASVPAEVDDIPF